MAPRKLGVIVGAAILLTNARTLASTFGVDGAWRTVMYLAIVAVVGTLAAWRLTQARERRRAKAIAAAPARPRAGRRLTAAGPPSYSYPRKVGWMTAASASSNASR